jgi:hypothetical protein
MRERARIFFMLLLAIGPACSDGSDPPPTQPPLPAEVKFGRDVLPIFTSRCAIPGCHVQPNPKAGCDMSADSCYANLVNVPTEVFTPGIRVTPGVPSQSVLYLLVESGQMPAQGTRLNSRQVAIIRKWIEDGALDD